MLTLAEIAAAHKVHPHTIKAWRRAGIVSAERYNDKGEYLYYPPDPDNPPTRPKIGRRPTLATQA
ncbi:MAG: MerR family transcriptional regulator [Actinoallomurus sp.]